MNIAYLIWINQKYLALCFIKNTLKKKKKT